MIKAAGFLFVPLMFVGQFIHTPPQPAVPVQDTVVMELGVLSNGAVRTFPNISTVVTRSAPVVREKRPRVSRVVQRYSFKASAYRGNRFYRGYCTWLVATKVRVTWRGNARDWIRNASAQGYTIGKTPRVGSIMQTRESYWGHVAYVTSVNTKKKTFTVVEMNYRGFGITSTRTIPFGYRRIVGFIYLK